MTCSTCKVKIFDFEDLFFYVQTANDVHLAVKPEKHIFFRNSNKIFLDSSNLFVFLFCKKCETSIGKEMNIGQEGSLVWLLNKKITIFDKNGKWKDIYTDEPYNKLETRSRETYFGFMNQGVEFIINAQIDNPKSSIKFADLSNPYHFKWKDILSSNKIPRDYQLLAYIEALQRNLIIVLPTGSGKTLIASLVAARMKRLNPEHMILFLVERIPLVFQQGKVLQTETHLKICCLCSETNTYHKVLRLREMFYDILVVTAGSFKTMLDYKKINLASFSCIILDECHHATGKHPYSQILNELNNLNLAVKPRIVGLTASPVTSKSTIETTCKLLRNLSTALLDAVICNFSEELKIYNKPEVIIKSIENQTNNNESTTILNKMTSLGHKINEICGENVIKIEDWEDYVAMAKLKGILYCDSYWTGDRGATEELLKLVKELKNNCAKLEVTQIAGNNYYDNGELNFDNHIPSPRMRVLLDILDSLSDDSKVLVFVRTRHGAEVLCSYLQQKENIKFKFNPLKIIGKSGALGMAWTDGQEVVIEEFHSNTCRLLISTSVLEEGIDIPNCDIVIRFDGVSPSLLAFAQGRGRARKVNGQYILILNKKDEDTFMRLQESEMLMEEAIAKINKNNPISLSKAMFQQQLNQKQEKEPTTSDQTYEWMQGTKCTVEFFIPGSHNELELKESIAKTLNSLFQMNVKRIHILNNNINETLSGIFSQQDTIVLMGFSSLNIFSSYHVFCEQWNFLIDNITTDRSLVVWSKLGVSKREKISNVNKWSSVYSIMTGSFMNRRVFEYTYECLEVEAVEFISKKCITVLCGSVEVQIFLTSINKFAICSWEKSQDDGIATLIFPVNCTPYVFQLDENNRKIRKTYPSHPLLNALSQSLVIGLKLRYNNSNWRELRNILHHPELLPIPIFDFKIVVQLTQTSPIKIIENNHPLSGINSLCVSDAMWAFSILCSNYDICFPFNDQKKLYDTIFSIADLSSLMILTEVLYFIISKLYLNNISNYKHSSKFNINSHLTLTFWDNVYDLFCSCFDEASKQDNSKLCYSQSLEENFQLNQHKIECAVITPTRVICLPPVICNSSRLSRQYHDLRFLIVAFREEQHKKLHSSHALSRITDILINGIAINGSKFYFLMCSNSQLRDHKALFVTFPSHINSTALEKIYEIRKNILGNTQIREESKYLARLGLFCSSDHPTLDIDQTRVQMTSDIIADNGVTLTDGAGKIDKCMANSVFTYMKEQLNLARLFEDGIQPAAMQIRLAGNKGVLVVVDKHSDPEYKNFINCDILLRPSMKKFDWTHSKLCVMQISKFNELYLNREAINLLTSLSDKMGGWDPSEKIKSLMLEQLMKSASVLINKEKAMEQLNLYLPNYFKTRKRHTTSYFSEVNITFDILTEPFLYSLLRRIYTYQVSMLTHKARIHVANGALLLGIPDPFGVLEEDQVFVRYKAPSIYPNINNNNNEATTLLGPVVVYKNPCLHPGDILRLTAVDIRELYNYVNVIIFPVKGSRSLPGSTGGGDLDGDEFSVIWDEDLIPPSHCIYPSLNYDVIAQQAKGNNGNDSDIPVSDDTNENIIFRVSNFYRRIIEDDLVGRIANMHVAVSDIKPEGAKHPLSIILAKSQSIAVDYPKTGMSPKLPNEVYDLMELNGYPDFMEKDNEVMYTSTKLLGELYRLCKAICYDVETTTSINNNNNNNNIQQYICNMSQCEFITEARIYYNEYCNAFQCIQISFGIESESEVFLGLIMKWHPMVNSNKGKALDALRVRIDVLLSKFRRLFLSDVNATNDILTKKAVAWYYAAYEEQVDKLCYRSFAWIVCDYLCKIQLNVLYIQRPIYFPVGKSALNYISQYKNKILNNVTSRLSVLTKLENAISKPVLMDVSTRQINLATNSPFNVNYFGSVALFLCESDSDLDISLQTNKDSYNYPYVPIGERENFLTFEARDQQIHFLGNFISGFISTVASSKHEIFNAPVPIIRCVIDSPISSDTEVKVDVVINSDGLQKAEYIKTLYVKSGGIVFAWLWILVQWARQSGIIKWSTVNSEGLIATAEFHAFALHILLAEMLDINELWNNSLNECTLPCIFDSLLSNKTNDILGKMLIDFFHKGAILAQKLDVFTFSWPINKHPSPTHSISGDNLKKINLLLFQAWHCLVFTRNVDEIFTMNLNSVMVTKKLPSKLSLRLEDSKDFHARRLHYLSGANVQIDKEGRFLLVRGEGPSSSIHKLCSDIEKLSFMTLVGKRPKIEASRYILLDGIIVVMCNGNVNFRIRLKDYIFDCFHLCHIQYDRSHILLASQRVDQNWLIYGREKILTVFRQQISLFTKEHFHILPSLKLKARFGFFYMLKCENTLRDIGNSLSLDLLETTIRKSKKYRDVITRSQKPTAFQSQAEKAKIDKKLSNATLKKSKYSYDNNFKQKEDSISSSFCPGIIHIDNHDDTIKAINIFIQALIACGFNRIDDASMFSFCKWRLSIDVTENYEADLHLDQSANVFNIQERSLIWVHCSIIADRRTQTTQYANDVRLKLETKERIMEDSSLYKLIFPEGLIRPLSPGFNPPKIIDSFKGKVVIVKQFNSREIFQKNSVFAKISTGSEYSGHGLKQVRKFCELTLLFNDDRLKVAIKNGNQDSIIQSIVDDAITTSMQLSEAIRLIDVESEQFMDVTY